MVAHNTEIHWQIPADCHMIAAVAGNFARTSRTRSKGWCKPPVSWLKLETDFPVLSYMLYARYAKTRIPYYAEGWDILSRPFQNRDTVPPSIAFQAAEKGQDMPRYAKIIFFPEMSDAMEQVGWSRRLRCCRQLRRGWLLEQHSCFIMSTSLALLVSGINHPSSCWIILDPEMSMRQFYIELQQLCACHMRKEY
jgi:hypothetical protein